jgi:mono/diheme cytochrome c family protein
MKAIMVVAAAVVLTAMTAGSASAQDLKAKGEKVFADQKCSTCHSIAGKGNVKGPLDDVGKKLSADEIRQWITDPAGMTAKTKAERKPAMTMVAAKLKALSKDDVDALVAYLSSLKGK